MLRHSFRSLVTLLAVLTQVQGQELHRISRELPSGVEVIRDIVYATYDDRSLGLDLYLPVERSADLLPVIVVIRGGGKGDKDGFGAFAAALAKRGLGAACIEYRVVGEAIFPAAVEDTKAAVRWLRANGARHQIDHNAIGAFGGGTGSYLALYLGVTSGEERLEGHGGSPSFSSAISSVVAFSAAADFTQLPEGTQTAFEAFLGSRDPVLWQYAAPITHVDEDSPPLLLIHSQSDVDVSFNESLRLAARYGEVGVPVEVVLIPGAPHAFWNYTKWFDSSMDRAAAFLWRHLGSGRLKH